MTVTSDTNVTLTVSQTAEVAFGVPFPKGVIDITAGVTMGYIIQCSNSQAKVSYSLVYPVSATLAAAISFGFRFEVVQYDPNANSYFALNTVYDVSKTLTFSPQAISGSNYTYVYITSIGASTTMPMTFGRKMTFNGNSNGEKYSLPYGLTLTLTTNGSASISSQFQGVTNPNPGSIPPSAYASASFAFFSFTTEQASQNFTATLQYSYNSTLVAAAGVIESTLRWAKFVGNQYQYLPSGGYVDVSEKIVYQITTGFSQWGIYGQNTTNGTPSPTSSKTTTVRPCIRFVILLIVSFIALF